MTGLNLSGARRTPLFRQSEAAECGLACVGMVAAAHGFQSDLATLRLRHPVSLKGMSLKDVIGVASEVGLGSRPIRCDPEEIRQLRLPAILHWDFNHFVVVTAAGSRSATILDPAMGKITLSYEEVGKHFTGVALELVPAPEFQRKRDVNPIRLSSLVRLDLSTWRAIWQALALSLFLQVFVLAGPYYMQLVIDEAILKSDLQLLSAIALGFAGLKLFEVITTTLRGLVVQFLSSALSLDMQSNLYRHMLRLPLPFFQRRHVGDIQQRFQSLQPIQIFLSSGAISAIIDGIFALLLVVILFVYDMTLAATVAGFLAAYAGARLIFLSLSKRLSGDFLVADAAEQSKFLETLRSIGLIKVSGIEDAREVNWKNLAAASLNAQIRMGNLNIGYGALSQLLMGFSNIVIVYLAAAQTIEGALTIGMITAFLAYKGQFEQRTMALLEQFIQLKLLDMHLERVSDIALHAKEENTTSLQPPAMTEGSVAVENLFFKYAPHEPDVLKGASFNVNSGEFVAIAAPSGAGKSTLLRLMIGLYTPTHGRVLYDGQDLKRAGASAIRSQLGVVMQGDTLLTGSIEENITLFDENPDRGRLAWAAKTALIDSEIDAMPMGYRTLVGDMGSTLSGGQQQRVFLARALYRRPRILIMDEGTSALDVVMERKINENLRGLGITRIVAAHRPETLSAADRIIGLVEGRCLEMSLEAALGKQPVAVRS